MATTDYNAGIDSSDLVISTFPEAAWGDDPVDDFVAMRILSETLSETKTRNRPAEIEPWPPPLERCRADRVRDTRWCLRTNRPRSARTPRGSSREPRWKSRRSGVVCCRRRGYQQKPPARRARIRLRSGACPSPSQTSGHYRTGPRRPQVKTG